MRSIVLLTVLVCWLINEFGEVFGIVGGQLAAEPPPDDPVVFVHVDAKDARVEGLRKTTNGLYSFLGLRYAEAPIGKDRFLRPKFRRLQGDINATLNGPPCPQPNPLDSFEVVGNEDCLLLNIYSPQMPDETTELPVIIWIHGGGFRFGSANQYGPDPLTEQKVIFVPIQYRLGSLGVIGAGDREFPGNLAFFDCLAAIEWVYEYITFFGGDPFNIKIMGHGSGAMMAMHMAQSALSRDIVKGIIAMSGSILSSHSIDLAPLPSFQEVSDTNSCNSNGNYIEIVECLQKLKPEDIIKSDSKIQTQRLAGKSIMASLTGFVNILPNVEIEDDYRGLPGFITKNPIQAVEDKDFAKVPLLIGTTKDETANALVLNQIKSIWGSLDTFMGNITSHLGLGTLIPPITDDLLKKLDLPKLTEYLKLPPNLSPDQLLMKLTEVTTDALFNLPMVLLMNVWSSIAPSFMYQFTYKGTTPVKGSYFLGNLPLVSQASSNKETVAHGDELIYLFDVLDIFGKPVPGADYLNTKDRKVRFQFTKLIAEFAGVKSANDTQKGGILSAPFSVKDLNFLNIGSDVKSEGSFRFCELSVWGLQLPGFVSKTCSFLGKGLGKIFKVAESIPIVGGIFG